MHVKKSSRFLIRFSWIDSHPALSAFRDGEPLPVGGNSKAPDARWGRGAGGLAKGYTLHTVWSSAHLGLGEAAHQCSS